MGLGPARDHGIDAAPGAQPAWAMARSDARMRAVERACEDAGAPGLKKRGWPPAPPPAPPLAGTKNCAAAALLRNGTRG